MLNSDRTAVIMGMFALIHFSYAMGRHAHDLTSFYILTSQCIDLSTDYEKKLQGPPRAA